MHGREVVVMKKMLAALLVLFMVCAFPVCAETNNYSDTLFGSLPSYPIQRCSGRS